MLKKVNSILGICLLFSLLNGTCIFNTAVLASTEEESRQFRRLDKMLDHLGLSDEQLAKIKDIRASYQPKIMEQKKAMESAREEMANLLVTPATTMEQAKVQYEKLQALQNAASGLRFEIIWKIREVLTQEQRKKLHDKLKTHREKAEHQGHRRFF